ncbi:MAG: hypothetical protein PHU85_12355 [Phycisphaerae bacterium]|nr:hypothetical protein [Phycisphaerae bacterium]
MRWNLIVKLKLLVVLGIALALAASVGYWSMLRLDPRGPFILAKLAHPSMAVMLMIGMIGLTAIIGALWLLRDLPGVAWLIIGAGWLGLALRSWPIDNELMFLSNEQLHRFYARLLAETGLYFAISGIVALLAAWAATMMPKAKPMDRHTVSLDETESPAPGRKPADRTGPLPVPPDELITLLTHVAATGIVATLVYLLLLNGTTTPDRPAGPILRGQILFALAAGFFLGSLAAHQVFPTRSPWGIVPSVPATAAAFYLFTIFAPAVDSVTREPAYLAPTRFGEVLPIDFMGLALPAAIIAYLISYRMTEARRENARRAAEAS